MAITHSDAEKGGALLERLQAALAPVTDCLSGAEVPVRAAAV